MKNKNVNVPKKEILEKELAAAFIQAENWYAKNCGPLGGFGQGDRNGVYILNNFMPHWFQKWHSKVNWHPVGLLEGLKGWFIWVKAFGFTEDEWWEEIIKTYEK